MVPSNSAVGGPDGTADESRPEWTGPIAWKWAPPITTRLPPPLALLATESAAQRPRRQPLRRYAKRARAEGFHETR